MKADLIVIVDFENICRLCLQSTGTLSDIFTAYDGKSLQQQILCITGLSTENGDGLPSKICHRCRHIIEQASELRDVVEKSHKILEKVVLDNVEQGPDSEPFDNEMFLQSLTDTKIDQDTVNTVKFAKNQDDTFIKYVSNKSEILPDASFNELNAKFFSEDGDLITEIPAEVPRAKVGQKPPADLVCQICLSQFVSKEEVRLHVEQHYVGSALQIYLDIKSRPYLCTFCDEIQLNKAQLVKHHRRHLGVNPFVCKEPGCKYVGKNMDGLRHHAVVHSEKQHVCETCGTSFRRRSDVASHVARVHPRAARARARLSAHVCGTCGMRTSNDVALRLHMTAHHFIPKYPCPHGACPHSYPSLVQLRDHERAHRGERRYRCHLCSKDEFTSNHALKRHILERHAAARSRMLTCAKCPATFEEHAVYYRHWLAHHGAWTPHRCRACNQGYPAEFQLLIHERTCDRLKILLSIITEHTDDGRRDAGGDELNGDEPLKGEIQEEFDDMEQVDETQDYGD